MAHEGLFGDPIARSKVRIAEDDRDLPHGIEGDQYTRKMNRKRRPETPGGGD